MITPDIIASIAAFFTMIGYIPQAIKTIRTKDTKGISFWMYLLSIIGVIFWLIFGIMVGNKPIILKNIAVIILGGTILWIKTVHILKEGEEKGFSKISWVKKLRKVFGSSKKTKLMRLIDMPKHKFIFSTNKEFLKKNEE
jgi:MtN3 and saliva related transmembrane protein